MLPSLPLRVLVLAALATATGCADYRMHTQVAELQETPSEEKVKRLGSISRAELLAGESPAEPAVMFDVGVVNADARGENQLCFRMEKKNLEGRTFSTDAEFRSAVEEGIRAHTYAVQSHDSADDFREGAPWPSANVKPQDVKVAGVDLVREKQKYRDNGTKAYRSSSRNVQWDVCAPMPPLTDATKFISFSILNAKPKDNRIAVWAVRP